MSQVTGVPSGSGYTLEKKAVERNADMKNSLSLYWA